MANAAGTVVQRNSFYPFGMSYGEESDLEQGKQPYKYNGKELDKMHGLNQYDYEARFMDPASIRFTSVDPHSENYYSWSPYVYVGNNPLRLVDPDGKDWRDKLAGFVTGVVSNSFPYSSSIRDVYTPNDRVDYNNTLKAVDDASTVAGIALTIYGIVSSTGGGGMMASGSVIAVTGVGAPEGGVIAATGAIVWGAGEATAFGGAMLANNAQNNASEGYNRGKSNDEGKSKEGRLGKQDRLRELANDPKQGSSDRGWIKQEINQIDRGKRKSIRNPPGKDLAHERGREAAKGYSYKYSNLQDRDLHKRQHRFDNGGRNNKERPNQ